MMQRTDEKSRFSIVTQNKNVDKVTPQSLATDLAKALQVSLRKRTGLEFSIGNLSAINPHIDARECFLEMSNPVINSNMRFASKVTAAGKFNFMPNMDIIKINVKVEEDGVREVFITVENAWRLPQKPVIFGLFQKSITREVVSSVKEALSMGKKLYGITHTDIKQGTLYPGDMDMYP